VWEVEAGGIKEYPGHYSDYEWVKSKEVLDVEVTSGSTKEPSSSKLNRDRKKKEAEERNQRYKNLKPLQKRLAKVESRLELLMQTNETLQAQLADATIYEEGEKPLLLKTLEEKTKLKAEEKILMQEWDKLTVEIEQIESSEQKDFSGI
jgi:ATP-binding cassette, subfamily F, member 3